MDPHRAMPPAYGRSLSLAAGLFAALCLLAVPSLRQARGSAAARRKAGPSIVAAENFYGGVARQVAGSSATVVSILDNLRQDPHDFSADAATAKAVADADILIYNGAGYDGWMDKLLSVPGKPGRVVVRVSDLVGAAGGANPHLWYDPRTMPALAAKLSEILGEPGPPSAFLRQMARLARAIARIRRTAKGLPVTATEPVFGDMARALGFTMENRGFQRAVMNDTEPSFRETVDFEKSLKDRSVRILFYNRQVVDPVTRRMLALARADGVAVVGVTETQPPDARDYADWMLTELDAVRSALKARP